MAYDPQPLTASSGPPTVLTPRLGAPSPVSSGFPRPVFQRNAGSPTDRYPRPVGTSPLDGSARLRHRCGLGRIRRAIFGSDTRRPRPRREPEAGSTAPPAAPVPQGHARSSSRIPPRATGKMNRSPVRARGPPWCMQVLTYALGFPSRSITKTSRPSRSVLTAPRSGRARYVLTSRQCRTRSLARDSGHALPNRGHVGEHELKGVPDRWRLYRVVGGRRSATPGTRTPQTACETPAKSRHPARSDRLTDLTPGGGHATVSGTRP
jgi:hypothetical protein